MRKLISVLLALVLLLGLLPAASAEDVYTLDIYWVGAGDEPEIRAGVEEAINAYIEPLIGAHVSFHIIPWADWEAGAVNVLKDSMATFEPKMDLIFTADWEFYSDLVSARTLCPLGDLLDRNGQGILSSLPESFWAGVKIDNAIYGIPTNKELSVPMGLLVNKTAAAAIGWDPDADPVTCTADLEPWLQKYKEMFPDKYPYLMDTGSMVGRWADEPWINDWSGLENNAVAMRMAKVDGEFDETVYSIFETPEQEAHIRLMYDWKQKGYIDPDTINYTDEGHSLFGKGDFLVYTQPLKGENIKAVEMYTQHHKAEDPEWEITEIILQPKYIVTAHTAGSMFSIPITSMNPDKAMQFLNLMHTDAKLVNLMLFGVEGVNYTKANDMQVVVNPDAAWYSVHAGAWTVGDVTLQYVLTNEDPEKNQKLIAFAGNDPKAVETVCLGFRLNLRKLQKEVTAVNDVVKQYANPLMVGLVDPDDAEYGIEAMKAKLKEAGIDAIVEEATQQYHSWKQSRK
ncbi:MAG: ABC transporter substrate-binding protein [Clostridiales bacterium]|nr:ABC transporter substrate-binding protein [Clostridiales bacterium]